MGRTTQIHEIQGIATNHTTPGHHQPDNLHQDCKHLQMFATREQITNTTPLISHRTHQTTSTRDHPENTTNHGQPIDPRNGLSL